MVCIQKFLMYLYHNQRMVLSCTKIIQTSRIIITKTGVTSRFLQLRSSVLNQPLSDAKIFEILSSILESIRSFDLANDDQLLIKSMIEEILSFKSAQASGNRVLPDASVKVLLDIYDALMKSTRSDTKGKSYWSQSLENSAYHFLIDMKCPTTITHTRTNFDLTVQRSNDSTLNGAKYTATGEDFFKYPLNLFPSSNKLSCTHVHFINMRTNQWFDNGNILLNNKVSCV